MSPKLDEIQAIFFEECAEGLAAAEAGLGALAAGEGSAETIAGVFRAVHSIKGGAGAFGHTALLDFSHDFENVLDQVRAGEIPGTPAIFGRLLAALDALSDHVGAAMGRVVHPQDGPARALLAAIRASDRCAAALPSVPKREDADDGGEPGHPPAPIGVDRLDPCDGTASAPGGPGPTAEPPPAPADEEGEPWLILFAPSRAAMANGAEPLLVLRELQHMGGYVTSADFTALPPLRDLDPEESYVVWTLELPGGIEAAEIEECFDFVAPDSRIEYRRGAAPVSADSAGYRDGPGSADPNMTPITAPAEAAPAAGADSRVADGTTPSIRIDVARLDLLLNLVGELVICNSILTDRLDPGQRERVELPQLGRLTREIQDNVMSLRAQPIRQAFSRVPRIVRELSAATAKQVDLQVTGEQTEVDRSVIEKIGEPLTHMIRNAIDHGLEPPGERIANGKSPTGTVRLSAEQKGAHIVIQIADDGRGIDRERVRAKAVAGGIIAPDAVLREEEIDRLICAPGFSTTETISNISGRGVGMDVVRTNVEALGGRIEISSTPGQGACFTMVLPLTLAILDGMIVRLSGQRYVVPLANVIESIRPGPGQVKPLSPTGEVIDLRGVYVPVCRVSDLLGLHANDRRSPEDSLVIIVERDGAGSVGLMVDAIDDRRELVVKSLDQNLYPINGLSGATILGDGSIALILDIDALVSTAQTAAGAGFAAKGMAA